MISSHGRLRAFKRPAYLNCSWVRRASSATKILNEAHLSKPARTRFAPSPTGYLHLGSLRTALFNYLLAHKTGGQFLLRIEDTDQKRTVSGAESRICEDLRWAGLQWDEGPDAESKYGPFRQSERTSHYQEFAQQLIESGHAYRCFCTSQRLEELARLRQQLGLPTDYDRQCADISKKQSSERADNGEPHVIRFRVPKEYPQFSDLVYGKVGKDKGSHTGITVKHGEIAYEDPVLLKTDGKPTYHLANVVDDHLMEITHVIRATEWMPSTPKHLALYEALGWKPPYYAHVGLMVNEGGQKLSKRHLHTDIQHYKEAGYLAPALVNFVALMGWSHDQRGDAMDLKELVEHFQMKFTRGNAVVKLDKLHYLQRAHAVKAVENDNTREEIIARVSQSVKDQLQADKSSSGKPLEVGIGELLRLDAANYTTPDAFVKRNLNFFKEPCLEDWARSGDKFGLQNWNELNTMAETAFSRINEWTSDSINDALKSVATEKDQYKLLCRYIRWFLLGAQDGPSLAHSMVILGRDACTRRLDKVKASAKAC